MKVIIHPGMHKTGTSSIQAFLKANCTGDFSFAPLLSENQSALLVLLFQDLDLLKDYHGFRTRGEAFTTDLPRLRKVRQAQLDVFMDTAADKTVIFSAEVLSQPNMRTVTQRLKEYLQRWTSDISVLAYVRAPKDYYRSAFQQHLKGDVKLVAKPGAFWPNYRRRFQKFDEIFGHDNVTIRHYSPDALLNGDVVQDFASAIGMKHSGEPIKRTNETLSAEATALLFLQRTLGEGFGEYHRSAQANDLAFINDLRSIGTSNFTFSDEYWQPIQDRNREDLAWIENRIGTPLVGARVANAIVMRNEADLIELALRSYPLLEALLLERISGLKQPLQEKTLCALSLLKTIHAQTSAHGDKTE